VNSEPATRSWVNQRAPRSCIRKAQAVCIVERADLPTGDQQSPYISHTNPRSSVTRAKSPPMTYPKSQFQGRIMTNTHTSLTKSSSNSGPGPTCGLSLSQTTNTGTHTSIRDQKMVRFPTARGENIQSYKAIAAARGDTRFDACRRVFSKMGDLGRHTLVLCASESC